MVERWLAGLPPGTGFAVVFCDPPYAFDGWPGLLEAVPADLVVAESDGAIPLPAGWELVRDARYGGTWVGFVQRATPGGSEFSPA